MNLLKPNQSKTFRLISGGFVVLCAVGDRRLRAAGFARTTLFTTDAERPGILLTRAGFVPDAIINGVGRIVCTVFSLRRTKIGMRKVKTYELKIILQFIIHN